MSKVRVLVGTKKGAFLLASDGKRDKWDVSGPHFAGWEIYHLKGSPVNPDRIYASQIERLVRAGHAAFQRRRKDLGDGRQQVPLRRCSGTHQWYDGTPHPWEFKRVWHLEPSLTDAESVYAGIEDAALFHSTDGGAELDRVVGPAQARLRPALAARRGRDVPAHHRARPAEQESDLIAISAAGAFRSDDAGATWKPINKGLVSDMMPNPTAEVGHCVHRIAMHPSRPTCCLCRSTGT